MESCQDFVEVCLRGNADIGVKPKFIKRGSHWLTTASIIFWLPGADSNPDSIGINSQLTKGFLLRFGY